MGDEIHEHAAFLRRLARALLGDEHLAEDVVQEAMVAAIQRSPQNTGSLRAWLVRVVRNRAFDLMRRDASRARRERDSTRIATGDAQDEIASRVEAQRQVLDLLSRMPEQYRTVIYLRYHEGLTPTQIGARTGTPVKTVKSRLSRALVQLRSRLDHGSDGDQGVWSRALVPLIQAAPDSGAPLLRSSTYGGVLVSAGSVKLWSLAAVALLLAVAWFVGNHSLEATTPQHETASVTALPKPVEVNSAAPAEITEAPSPEILRTETAVAPSRIEGRVVDGESGEGIVDVLLHLHPRDVENGEGLDIRSGTNGVFAFANLNPGTYTLETRPVGDRAFECDPRAIEVGSEAIETIELPVEPRWYLSGVVVEAGSSVPVPGLVISAHDDTNPFDRTTLAVTDSRGQFRSEEALPAGRKTLIHGRGYEGLTRFSRGGLEPLKLMVGSDDVTGLRLEFRWVGEVNGRVIDERGRAVSGATVRPFEAGNSRLTDPKMRSWALSETAKDWGTTTRTDESGAFVLRHLPNDRKLCLLASAKGLATTVTTDLEPPFPRGQSPVEIRLTEGGVVLGTVRDAVGTPIGGSIVMAAPAAGGAAPDPARADADGRFRLDGLAPGSYHVSAAGSNGGAALAGHEVEVEGGGEHQVQLDVAARTARISGRVVDSQGGVPLSLGSVGVFCASWIPPEHLELPRRVEVDADGRFEITNLRAGHHRVILRNPAFGSNQVFVDVDAPAEDVRLVFDAGQPIIVELSVVDGISNERVGTGELVIDRVSNSSVDQRQLRAGFTRIGILAGQYTMSADVPGYAPHSEELDLRGITERRIQREIRLDSGRRVSGVVLDPAGAPVTGVSAILTLGERRFYNTHVYVDDRGRFTFDHAPLVGGGILVVNGEFEELGSSVIGEGEVQVEVVTP